jgi:hypothetical protein
VGLTAFLARDWRQIRTAVNNLIKPDTMKESIDNGLSFHIWPVILCSRIIPSPVVHPHHGFADKDGDAKFTQPEQT